MAEKKITTTTTNKGNLTVQAYAALKEVRRMDILLSRLI